MAPSDNYIDINDDWGQDACYEGELVTPHIEVNLNAFVEEETAEYGQPGEPCSIVVTIKRRPLWKRLLRYPHTVYQHMKLGCRLIDACRLSNVTLKTLAVVALALSLTGCAARKPVAACVQPAETLPFELLPLLPVPSHPTEPEIVIDPYVDPFSCSLYGFTDEAYTCQHIQQRFI